ncbi:DUF1203 domain-containing protein [Streptomyces sp. LX-29]|uniref:DUF1203 domain-containing protein n=1 Tax=Streptomyces sp. LX-29 TaxID=2900152 RepID=UPI00240DBDFC|nr:DUF1203 domain-containing protein [Streptomyces sp. LX-29]WFB06710.1 DUF1203 domain-containing protein [Streptomyces sp. LX-29]
MSGVYEVRAIAPEVLERLRERDDAGRPPRLVTEEGEGGTPLRCCLGRSGPGEELALLSYAPLRRWARETGADPGAYDETGPVFVHAVDCGGWSGDPGRYPVALHGERRVLRAYSARGTILGGRLLDGQAVSVERALAELYADPEVAAVHVRAVEFGCFHAETRRVAEAR